MAHRNFIAIRALLLASTALAFAGAAFAQEAVRPPATAPETTDEPAADQAADRVVVVGSQIRGAEVTDALPVTVVTAEEISTVSAASGDELFRSIPQLGDVAFNSSRTIGSVNDARGDTASINLRALGTGNTLVLLNGRRMVNHPGTQAENSVPVVSANTNSIPVLGVERVEVLLDGASAIYGADAVAGVVNTVLKSDFEGFTADLNVGQEEGISGLEISAAMEGGWNFNDDRTNISLFASYFTRDPIFARDRDFTANADLTSRGGTNGTSTTSAWGGFDRFTAGNITINGTVVTNANGQFHIQPATLPFAATGQPCTATPNSLLPGGLCIDTTSTRDTALRYNVNDEATVQNGVDRLNTFLTFNNEFDGGVELFGEGGLYFAQSLGFRESAPMLGAVPVVIPATNYFNPFGPVGSPNRIAGSNAPAGGLAISLTGYRPVDAGPRRTEVINLSSRVLLGLRGEAGGGDWETALLYSKADSEDKENRISNTRFQETLGWATPDAYNPFNGGCLNNFANDDCTPTSASTIAYITVPVTRRSETSIASWDAKWSRPDLFTWWAGDIGAAFGVELRHETFVDNRDPRQDGTLNFTDSISGLTANDLLGNNPSLDVKGERDVQSAYLELAVPIVSRDWNVPLVQSVDAQLAVRYENFDYFGEVTKPKVALSWRVADFLMLRSAWSEGFRAPNLQQQFERGLTRSNAGTDLLRCAAADTIDPPVVFNGTTCSGATAGNTNSTFLVASAPLSVVSQRSGSLALEPEESENTSAGFVLESTFLPPEWGEITFTADWWNIKQEGVIGTFGDANQILLDYVRRTAPGCNVSPLPASCTNPAVVRAAPTPEDTAAFTAAGIQPVGAIQFVQDNYLNSLPREAEGVDLGVYYKLDGTPLGDFSFRINGAYLAKFFQQVSEQGAEINAAVAAGRIPAALSAGGEADLVRNFGRPEWRYSGQLTWENGPYGAGWFTSYVGSVLDGAFEIGEYQTHNLYLQYELGHDSDSPTRLRLGVRNLFDETPPLANTTFGYLGDLHNPAGRFIYVNARKSF